MRCYAASRKTPEIESIATWQQGEGRLECAAEAGQKMMMIAPSSGVESGINCRRIPLETWEFGRTSGGSTE